MTRKLAFAVVLLFLASLTAPLAGEAKGKTHEVTTEVVSADVAAMTITIKGENGKNMTAPVGKGALEELKKVKAGDKVVLTCQDNEKGEHEAVTAIKPAKT